MALLLNANDTVSRSYSYTIPSPNHVSEVQAVGDRTGNLFDYKKYFESTFTKYSEYFEWAEIQLKPFTTYTFTTSFSESTTATGVINTAFIITSSAEEPKTLTGGISSTRIATKTTEADGIIKIYKRIKGIYLPKKEDFDSGMYWLMINEGDTALPYEPYGYKIPVVTSADGAEPITTPIYLPTPLYSGEVLRSDGSREVKWGKITFDGSSDENWDILTRGYRIYVKDSQSVPQDQITNALCSHFVASTYPGVITNGVVAFSQRLSTNGKSNGFAFSIGEKANNLNIENWRKRLSESPVTVWYRLATPTTETFTAPQIPTLNGTTVIDVDTAVKPTEMYAKYKSSK